MFGPGEGGLLWEIFGLRPVGNVLGPGRGWKGPIHLGLLPCGVPNLGKGEMLVVQGVCPKAAATPWNLLEMQISRPQPGLTESDAGVRVWTGGPVCVLRSLQGSDASKDLRTTHVV